MISQKRSGRPTLVMYALGIPVLLLLLFAFTYSYQGDNYKLIAESEKEYTSDADVAALVEFATLVSDTVPANSKSDAIFKVVEEMPRFPGCEDMEGSAREIEDCAKQKMLEHIYTNLKYPKADKDNGVEGMSVVQFVITSKGELQDAKVIRSLSITADAEVLRVTNAMNALPAKWRPGMQRGQAVNVLYTLPVRFKLQDNDSAEEKETIDMAANEKSEEVFKVVEEMPRFPGCEDMEGGVKAKGDCSKRKMLEFIYSNLKYPKEDKENGIEGISIVQFIVDEAGNIMSPKVIRSLSSTTDAEVLQIVRKMNDMESKWIPGRQKGKTVKVQYTLPVRFKLQGDAEQKEVAEEKPTESIFRLKTGGDDKSGSTLSLSSRLDEEEKPLIYLDGVEVDQSLDEIDPNTIASVSVYKGEKAIAKYGQKGKNGVIEIKSKGEEVIHEEVEKLIEKKPESISIKTESGKKPLYVIDGEVKPQGVDEELSPDMIESINVLKGEAAIDKYGEKASNGVIEITTKGKKVLKGKVEFDTPAYWPGCSDLEANQRELCSNKNLISYVGQNLKYSKEAVKKGIEGMVVTGFTVDQNGRVKDIKIKKNVKGLDKSALQLLEKMSSEIVWEAATKNGKNVAMEMVLPIKFKLPKDKQVETNYNECAKLDTPEERAKCKEKMAAIAKKALEALDVMERDFDHLELETVNVYPNPARETVNISFKAAAKATTIQLIDIDGKLIRDMSDKNFNGNFDQTIDLSEFSTNLILLRVEQEGKVFTRKIIVE